MKKLLILCFSILSGLMLAQNTYNFNYRLDYIFPGFESEYPDMIFTRHYIPAEFSEENKNSLLHFPIFIGFQAGYSFLNGNQLIQVENTNLENNFTIGGYGLYGLGETIQTLYEKVELRKIDRTSENILGKSCNFYEVITTLDGEIKPSDIVLCVDETHEIDNLSFLLPKQEGKQIKGLVLAIASPDDKDYEKIILSSIEKINSSIHFDIDKEIADYQVKVDSIKNLLADENVSWDEAITEQTEGYDAYDYYDYHNYMTQPQFCNYSELYNLKFEDETSISFATPYISSLCNYTYYMKAGDEEKYKKFALKEIKGVKKNAAKSGLINKKDANLLYEFLKKDIEAMKKSTPKSQEDFAVEAAADAVVAAAEEAVEYDYFADYYVDSYKSEYMNLTPEMMNFAFETLSADSPYWEGMPSYCKEIDSIIPEFSNQEISKHAKNYAGQICDMYMGEFYGSNVWYKGTLDGIRAEQMYFNKNRDEFSKKDKKLLDEFLDKLD